MGRLWRIQPLGRHATLLVLVSVRIVWSVWIVMNLDRFLKMLGQGGNNDQNNFLL